MSYEVLARKLRPSGFASLVGQDHVVRALTHALDHDRLHHAYLFTGTRGVGKTTIARILAKSLNCEQGVSATPCGECSVCTEVKENRFIDLIEVDAASRTGVDDTRDLLENTQYMPSRGRYKVYLIDEVHMLSIASFNALLKTLEEPPPHVKFLLATTDPKKVPVTVLSRCLQFQLKNISPQMISGYICDVLEQEGVEFQTEAVNHIARAAQGSMRDALSLTDQGIAFGQGSLKTDDIVAMLGVVGRNEVDALMQGIESGSAETLLNMTADLAERNADFEDVLKGLMEALHQQAVAAALNDEGTMFAADELQLYYQIALIGLRDINIAPDLRSGFEMTLLRMLAFAPEPDSKVPPRGSNSSNHQPLQEPEDTNPQVQTSAAVEAGQAVDAGVVAEAVEAADVAEAVEAADVAKPVPAAESESASLAPVATDLSQSIPAIQTANKPDLPSVTETIRSEENVHGTPTDSALANQWYDWVSQLEIGGVAKMLAEHAFPERIALPLIDLRLAKAHDTLLTDSQVVNLGRALATMIGQPVTLNVDVGVPSSPTPAEYREARRQERQQEAEQAIAEDETVQRLLAQFNGTIEHVRPKEAP